MAFFIERPIVIEKGIWAFKILSSIDFAKMNYKKIYLVWQELHTPSSWKI